MQTRRAVLAGLVVSIGAALLLWFAASNSGASNKTAVAGAKSEVGLITSLPILWAESTDFAAALSESDERHWVRAELERRFVLEPLDVLADDQNAVPSAALARLNFLILAQPPALPPADLAALDDWLRAGGRALIFADPLLTAHSEFGIGDKRRPEAIALLSPLLSRWGLATELVDQAHDHSDAGEVVDWNGAAIPVEVPGQFVLVPTEFANCELTAGGVIAECSVGKGRALVVADAALLDARQQGEEAATALSVLVNQAFDLD